MNSITNMLLCLHCGKELNSKQKKFCCSSCAAIYNNSHREKTTKGKTKQFTCQQCGNIFMGSIHLSKNNITCPDCKQKIEKEKIIKAKSNKICKICGAINCTNDFCKHPSGRLRQIESLIKFFGFDKNKLGTKDVFVEYNRIKNEL